MTKSNPNKIALLITLLVFLLPVLYIFRDKIELPTFEIFKSERKAEEGKEINKDRKIGRVVDEFKGVKVYYNGKVRNVSGRNVTRDGYNLGLKYQCVEFVKRYYYERFRHKMPDSYGHAKDFFDRSIADGGFNAKRALYQFSNPSNASPEKEDILVYGAAPFNEFGHIAIITKVTSGTVECISQNLGKGNGTRRTYALKKDDSGKYKIDEPYILGWLGKR